MVTFEMYPTWTVMLWVGLLLCIVGNLVWNALPVRRNDRTNVCDNAGDHARKRDR
jgi:hypothetical protein